MTAEHGTFSKAGSYEQTYGTQISSRMLAGRGSRELLGTHGARSGARRVPAPDRATGTGPRAGAGCFRCRPSGCWRLGNPAAAAALGNSAVGEAEAGEPAGFLPQHAGGDASQLCV